MRFNFYCLFCNLFSFYNLTMKLYIFFVFTGLEVKLCDYPYFNIVAVRYFVTVLPESELDCFVA